MTRLHCEASFGNSDFDEPTSKSKLQGYFVLSQNTLIDANIFLCDIVHYQDPLTIKGHVFILFSYFDLSSILHPDHLKKVVVNRETMRLKAETLENMAYLLCVTDTTYTDHFYFFNFNFQIPIKLFLMNTYVSFRSIILK